MTQERLIRIIGYYNDPSFIEKIVAIFRNLMIDIDWIYGRRTDNQDLYEIYLYVKNGPNLLHAILDLSKTVGIKKIMLCTEVETKIIKFGNEMNKDPHFLFYLPKDINTCIIRNGWGTPYAKNI